MLYNGPLNVSRSRNETTRREDDGKSGIVNNKFLLLYHRTGDFSGLSADAVKAWASKPNTVSWYLLKEYLNRDQSSADTMPEAILNDVLGPV